jgi:hypothetical protein
MKVLLSGLVGAVVGVAATFGVYLVAAGTNSDATSYVVPVECVQEDSCYWDYDGVTNRYTLVQEHVDNAPWNR